MKKRIPIIIALIATIAAAVFFGHTTKSVRIYDNNVNTVSYVTIGVPEEGQVLTQEFVCREDRIHGFRIKAGVQGDASAVTVHLELKDAATGEVLVAVEEAGANIRPRKIHYFRTEELTGLKGKDLILSLREEGTDQGNGILMYYAQEELPEHPLYLNDTAMDGVLPMATATERFDAETFIIFLLSVWFIWGFMWFLYKLFQ